MPRLILRSSTSGTVHVVSLSALPAACLPGEMGTSTLFLTHSLDDRGLERSLEPPRMGPHGNASSFPVGRSVPSCAWTRPFVMLREKQGNIIHPSTHQHHQSNLCLRMFICC